MQLDVAADLERAGLGVAHRPHDCAIIARAQLRGETPERNGCIGGTDAGVVPVDHTIDAPWLHALDDRLLDECIEASTEGGGVVAAAAIRSVQVLLPTPLRSVPRELPLMIARDRAGSGL
ncbi:hypothetical protein QWY84_06335 [Aquisalimonas lutea]|nr:hypothetical protein [Aquisalimonas lutea]MDN3517218.1 hypothetical protein [Aquisalimonas lutea]